MTPRKSTKEGKSGCFWGREKKKSWYCFVNKLVPSLALKLCACMISKVKIESKIIWSWHNIKTSHKTTVISERF